MTARQSTARAPPGAADIRALRESLGLTQEQAGALIHCSARAWQNWEGDLRRMHPAMWELFRLKTGQTGGDS